MPKPVALVIGASRGIGRQVALDLARNGYRVVVAAKSDKPIDPGAPFPPDPNSQQSTIRTVQKEIQQILGGSDALAFAVDTRSPESVAELIQKTEAQAGSLDVLVYNAGAIWWSSVQNTPFKRFRLMQQVNVEGLYAAIQASLPVFERQHWQGRVIVVSPPIYSRFFRGKTAYAMGKVAMSVLVKGLAMDWKRDGKTGMAITSIWPAVAIQSAATPDPDLLPDLRKPTIYSDAILAMLRAPVEEVNGCLELDEDFLRRQGVTDFSKYNVVPGTQLRRIMPAVLPDLTVAEQDDEGRRMDSSKL